MCSTIQGRELAPFKKKTKFEKVSVYAQDSVTFAQIMPEHVQCNG